MSLYSYTIDITHCPVCGEAIKDIVHTEMVERGAASMYSVVDGRIVESGMPDTDVIMHHPRPEWCCAAEGPACQVDLTPHVTAHLEPG